MSNGNYNTITIMSLPKLASNSTSTNDSEINTDKSYNYIIIIDLKLFLRNHDYKISL